MIDFQDSNLQISEIAMEIKIPRKRRRLAKNSSNVRIINCNISRIFVIYFIGCFRFSLSQILFIYLIRNKICTKCR